MNSQVREVCCDSSQPLLKSNKLIWVHIPHCTCCLVSCQQESKGQVVTRRAVNKLAPGQACASTYVWLYMCVHVCPALIPLIHTGSWQVPVPSLRNRKKAKLKPMVSARLQREDPWSPNSPQPRAPEQEPTSFPSVPAALQHWPHPHLWSGEAGRARGSRSWAPPSSLSWPRRFLGRRAGKGHFQGISRWVAWCPHGGFRPMGGRHAGWCIPGRKSPLTPKTPVTSQSGKGKVYSLIMDKSFPLE